MTNREIYVTYGYYHMIILFIAAMASIITVILISIGFAGITIYMIQQWYKFTLWLSNPLFIEMSRRPIIALIALVAGCIFGIVFSYFPILEFWRRTRPTRINDRGVEVYFLGQPLRMLPWVKVRTIVKLRYVHPIGYVGESVWFRGMGGSAIAKGDEAGESANLWRAQLALFPKPGIWMTSNMSIENFRTACDVATYYANLHNITMELWDMGPDTLRNLKGVVRRDVYRAAQRRGVVSKIDHL